MRRRTWVDDAAMALDRLFRYLMPIAMFIFAFWIAAMCRNALTWWHFMIIVFVVQRAYLMYKVAVNRGAVETQGVGGQPQIVTYSLVIPLGDKLVNRALEALSKFKVNEPKQPSGIVNPSKQSGLGETKRLRGKSLSSQEDFDATVPGTNSDGTGYDLEP